MVESDDKKKNNYFLTYIIGVGLIILGYVMSFGFAMEKKTFWLLIAILGFIIILLTIKFSTDPKYRKKILASADIIIGLAVILIGLWSIKLGDPFGLLITGLGSGLLIIVLSLFAPDKEPPITEKETTTEKDSDGKVVKIIEKETTGHLKWKNYSKTERAFKLFGILIIIFGLSFVIWLGLIETDSLKGIGIIGLGSFVVVLAGAFCLSDKWNLHAWEFRKALTISIISVYFSTMAFSNKIVTTNISSNGTNLTNTIGFINSAGDYQLHQWTLVEPVFNHLWVIVGLVITFYFATDWITKFKNGKDKE
ncbi:MAG: hypothetical protein ABFC91_01510 [Methanobacteriaceae archaeon]